MGKNIGGTLGAPMEWHRLINNVEFYQQELYDNPIPNDDLDLQLLWLIASDGFEVLPNKATRVFMQHNYTNLMPTNEYSEPHKKPIGALAYESEG